MKRAVVIGGGDIRSYERIRKELTEDDFFIYCDSGIYHEEKLGYKADLIVGDFDSSSRSFRDTETIVLPCEKDDTDTLYGVKEAFRRGYKDFLLLGMTGRRLDHTLANLYILDFIEKNEGKGKIIDDWSEIEVVGKDWIVIPDSFSYFSLISWKGRSSGITIENAKYPLSDAVIDNEQYGVSNEPLFRGARVRVLNGSLLLIKDYKEDN